MKKETLKKRLDKALETLVEFYGADGSTQKKEIDPLVIEGAYYDLRSRYCSVKIEVSSVGDERTSDKEYSVKFFEDDVWKFVEDYYEV